MTAFDYLRRPDKIRLEIERRKRRIAFLHRMSSQFSPILQDIRVRESPDPVRMQAFLAEAADEEREVLRLEEARKQALVDSALAISLLPDDQTVALMEMRYLEQYTWKEIESTLFLSHSSVHRIHRQALVWLDALPEIRDFPEGPE